MIIDLIQQITRKLAAKNRLDLYGRRGVVMSTIYKEVEQDVAGGAATVTITNFIPAGALVRNISARVTVALAFGSGPPTAVMIGDGTVNYEELAPVVSNGIAKDVTAVLLTGSPSSPITAPKFYAANTSLVLSFRGTAATFTSGKVRIVMVYDIMDQPKG